VDVVGVGLDGGVERVGSGGGSGHGGLGVAVVVVGLHSGIECDCLIDVRKSGIRRDDCEVIVLVEMRWYCVLLSC
jgi:hypothetical protein